MDSAAEREALRAHYEAVREPLLRAVEGLTDEQMLEPRSMAGL